MIIFRISLYIMTSVFIILFLLTFLPSRFKSEKTFLITGPIVIMMIVVDIVRFRGGYEANKEFQMLMVLIEGIVVCILAVGMSKYRDFRALFVALSSLCFGVIGKVIAATVYIYDRQISASLICGIVAEILILYFVKTRLKDVHIELMESSRDGWGQLCLVPLLFYGTINLIGYYPYTIYDRPEQIAPTVGVLATLMATYVIFFGFLKNRIETINVEKLNETMLAYTKGLDIQVAEIERTRSQIKMLRHDIRHYMNLINGLLEKNDYDGIRAVLKELEGSTEEGSLENYCKNKFVKWW
ncbi:MAG: hypothetical protein RR495_02820 [Anaerovoracaceae bacterium]